MTAKTHTPIEDQLATSMLGEGIHTGLRKGTDAEDAHELWKAISDSPTDAWGDAIRYAIWGLGYMGYKICKVEEAEPEKTDPGLDVVTQMHNHAVRNRGVR